MKRPSSTRLLRDPVFFTDRDLGKIVPRALRKAGHRVERHDDHFEPTTLDTEWLREVGRRRWIAITHNKDIRYNAQERDMAMRAGVPLFMLIGHYPHDILARNLVQTLPWVFRFLEWHRPPFIARIYKAAEDRFSEGKPGKVNLWLSYDQWLEIVR